MDKATEFKRTYADRYYFTLFAFDHAVGPNYHLSSAKEKRNALCQYCIIFTDGSSVQVVMSGGQRSSLVRTNFWKYIKTVGGEGYRKVNQSFHSLEK